jgi:hypothetical protein
MFVGMVACKGATRTELAAVQAKPLECGELSPL